MAPIVPGSPRRRNVRAAPIHISFRQRQRPGSLSYAQMHGPRLDLDTTSIVPVQMRRIHERCDLPDGLAVTTDGRRVSAFSKPMTSSDEIRTWGDFVVRRISGRLTLVGFVAVHYSDLFIAGPTGTGCPQLRAEGVPFMGNRWMGAVEAQFTAPEPGPIDVVIFANEGAAVRHATAVVVE